MAITKIEDLDTVIYENRIVDGCEDGQDFTEFYEKKGVEELVDHLQSKTIWHDIRKTKPEFDQTVFVNGTINRAMRGFDDYQKTDYFDCSDAIFYAQEIQFWCYESDFLKTLPEINSD